MILSHVCGRRGLLFVKPALKKKKKKINFYKCIMHQQVSLFIYFYSIVKYFLVNLYSIYIYMFFFSRAKSLAKGIHYLLSVSSMFSWLAPPLCGSHQLCSDHRDQSSSADAGLILSPLYI